MRNCADHVGVVNKFTKRKSNYRSLTTHCYALYVCVQQIHIPVIGPYLALCISVLEYCVVKTEAGLPWNEKIDSVTNQ